MGTSPLQKFELAPLTAVEGVDAGGYKMTNSKVELFTEEKPPGAEGALLFSAEAGHPEGKGDFNVAKRLEGNTRWVGAWFYVGPESNVKRLGVQFHEKSGEYMCASFDADFIGWKWLETEITDPAHMMQAFPQNDHNGQLDEEVDRISIFWWSKGPGPSSLGVTGLTTAAD